MEVLVYRLRQLGEALSRDDIRRQGAARGVIRVCLAPAGRLGQWVRDAHLLTTEGGLDVLPPLHDVVLTRWESRGALLSGFEEHAYRKTMQHYRQTWFLTWPEPQVVATLRSEDGRWTGAAAAEDALLPARSVA
jgi:hypothetical protein